MYVVATAGHVDHGKSTLVNALTQMEPDRWEEEKRRGLTIDLGFAWTKLPSGSDVAFVDVPGHERFLGNMLAGVGPVSVVMFVVAADEGWQAQSTEHLDAIAALGIGSGIVVLSRADKASEKRIAQVRAEVKAHLQGTLLVDAPVVEVSAHTGQGIAELKEALDLLLSGLPAPDPKARVRMWIDRAFSIKGAGTVVTGTLAAGTLSVGDKLELNGRLVDIRGLHSENQPAQNVGPVSRVAVNLRGIEVSEIHRGDQLLTPDSWPVISVVDVRVEGESAQLPAEVVVHVGSAGVPTRVRPLSAGFARLQLSQPLALTQSDRLVLRATSIYPAVVMDVLPPPLRRRGAAAQRAQELEQGPPSVADYVGREGAMRASELRKLGITGKPPAGVIEFSGWWISALHIAKWKNQLLKAVEEYTLTHPLAAGFPRAEATRAIGLPSAELLGIVVAAAKLVSSSGYLNVPEPEGQSAAHVDLGSAEALVRDLEKRWKLNPFDAPEANELDGISAKQLAAAERAGRIVRVGSGIVLAPSALDKSKDLLAQLEQPFSTSQARQILGTTRRVAIPLLEFLDKKLVTRRLDSTLREIR